jgi:hypothetical protein
MGGAHNDLDPERLMGIRAALETLLENWWEVLPNLDPDRRISVLTQLRALEHVSNDPASDTSIASDILASVLTALPPDHPVARAARQDEPRGLTAPAAPEQIFADLRALAGLATPATAQELARLDPKDLAVAVGLQSPWQPDTPVDSQTAARLWHLAEILARIHRATGQDSLANWFAEPAPRLLNQSPRDLIAHGDIQALENLAAALEDFTVS